MKNNQPKIIVMSGPTASGKSALVIRLARKFNGEIISADSRQVYRGMDIGTGKVTKAEQRLARHWMLDVVSPARQYTVAQWKKGAEHAVSDILRRGKVPIVCGGTGFWIDALIYDLSLPQVRPDPALRTRLGRLSKEELFARLKALDPARAATIDRHNKRRLVRALEIVLTTGKPIPASPRHSPYRVLYLAVSLPKEKLAARIAKRLDARLKTGMAAEVQRLHAGGVSWQRLENFGLEYCWLARFLQKKITCDQMREGLYRDIVRYSKRQMTWFRKNKDVTWITSATRTEHLARQFLAE